MNIFQRPNFTQNAFKRGNFNIIEKEIHFNSKNPEERKRARILLKRALKFPDTIIPMLLVVNPRERTLKLRGIKKDIQKVLNAPSNTINLKKNSPKNVTRKAGPGIAIGKTRRTVKVLG